MPEAIPPELEAVAKIICKYKYGVEPVDRNGAQAFLPYLTEAKEFVDRNAALCLELSKAMTEWLSITNVVNELHVKVVKLIGPNVT